MLDQRDDFFKSVICVETDAAMNCAMISIHAARLERDEAHSSDSRLIRLGGARAGVRQRGC
jgi:hypothetical protein